MKQWLRLVVVKILTWEAQAVLRKYRPRIIAVTGSVGKTSTKDAIYSALESFAFVRKSEKSFNSEIGVPLTILGCDTGWSNPIKWLQNIIEGLALLFLVNHYPKWLVLEVGADKPGDIKKVAQWLKPNIVVITALPDVPVHVENFPNPKDVAREKRSLAEHIQTDGTLILNGDDKRVATLATQFPAITTVLYGVEPHNDIVASHISIVYERPGHPIGMQFRVNEKGSSIPLIMHGRLGQQQIYSVLAAFAVARAVGAGPLAIAKVQEKEQGPRARMRVLEGYNDTTIIDDSYNSSPVALRAALSTVKKIETPGRKIAVLGDMLELGRFSSEAHKKAGIQAAGIVDVLVTVGVRAQGIAEAAREAGLDAEKILSFDSGEAKEAGVAVRDMLEPNDVVLLKGSQSGIRLEKAVRELLKEPHKAKEILVRQEDAWQVR